jgi:CDP-glucose 4,6-dehydratase
MYTLNGKTVLVTGASGFIGKALCKHLMDIGAYVHVTEHDIKVPDGVFDELWPCDLRNLRDIMWVVKSTNPDFVFHLASQAIVADGEQESLYTVETNVMGTFNLLHSLTKIKDLHGVIVASTDKVYGRASVPYDEDTPLLGTHQVYEASKTCEDVLSQMAYYDWKLPIGITRFANVYGPGDIHPTRLIPHTISSYKSGAVPVIRSNGQHYRDFTYIDDAVSAYIKLAQYVPEHKDTPNIFSFGTGNPARVVDVVAMISEHFPKSKPPKILHKGKQEIQKQYINPTKAFELLGWGAKTKLRDGIAETVKWFNEQ